MLYSREQILQAVRNHKISIRSAMLMLKQLQCAQRIKQENGCLIPGVIQLSRVSADFADIMDAHAESISTNSEDITYSEARQSISNRYSDNLGGFDDPDSFFDDEDEDY